MLELYFVFYAIPKTMSQLARERQRSPVAWSLIGIGAWLGAEIIVAGGIGLAYGIWGVFSETSEEFPMGLQLLTYLLALGAAILSFLLVKRFLTSRPKPQFSPPPPPPIF
ncbi:MAG TPA: hypothetical protein VGQ39_00850 [Pyrinomonadaceae bacterium]|jgi:membrane protein implicated in regulation of membrane protease activity|nr:hypothetical protein [Pyrinomonadaceae bacterium]